MREDEKILVKNMNPSLHNTLIHFEILTGKDCPCLTLTDIYQYFWLAGGRFRNVVRMYDRSSSLRKCIQPSRQINHWQLFKI
jgi:hypothetical protein